MKSVKTMKTVKPIKSLHSLPLPLVRIFSLCVFCASALYSSVAYGAVHRCIRSDAGVFYQDFPCEIPNINNKTLPIEYEKTDRKRLEQNKKTEQEKTDKLTKKKQVRERKQKGLEDREKKAKLKTEKRERWYKERCNSTKKQKKALLERLNRGHSDKFAQRTRAKIQTLEERERKYCENSR